MSYAQTHLALIDLPEHYLRRIQQFPILQEEEERELTHRLWYQGDVAAAKRLILCHLRFVVHIARTYMGYGLSQADLIQEGNIGLMKAVKRFNPAMGVRLVSFAVHWIKAEIHAYVLKNWRIIKIATTKAQRKLFFNLRKTKRKLAQFTQIERKHLANQLGVSPEEVVEMERRLENTDLPIDLSPSSPDRELDFHHRLADKSSNFSQQFEAEEWSQHAHRCLGDAVEKLNDREKNIIQSRWLRDQKQTLQALAEHYNISPERVRQLEKTALQKLKLSMGAQASSLPVV